MEKTKKYLLYTLIIIMLVAFAFALEQNMVVNAMELTPDKITVIGTSTMNYSPDTAFVTIGVETMGEDRSSTEQENKTTINNVLNLLHQNGIEEKDIKTIDYRIYDKYDFRSQEKVGVKAVNYVEFKYKDLDNLSRLITELTDTGVTHVNGVRYCIEDKSSAYNEVLGKAIDNAKEKAFAISQNSDLNIKEVKEEYTSVNSYAFDTLNLTKEGGMETSLSKGQVAICAKVVVVFGK